MTETTANTPITSDEILAAVVLDDEIAHVCLKRCSKSVRLDVRDTSQDARDLLKKGNAFYTVHHHPEINPQPSFYVQGQGMPLFVAGPDLHKKIEPRPLYEKLTDTLPQPPPSFDGALETISL